VVAPSHLRSFQALELAIRTGSLRAAAELLAITPAAVGQRVKALEDYLGVDLLARGRSGLRPAPALESALPHLAQAFRELETAAGLLDLQRGHEIHIGAAPDFADLWLKSRLAAFQVAHPNVRFCINGEGDAPLRLGHVDCQIDFGPEGGGAETLFADFLAPIGSPEITRRIANSHDRRDRLEGFPLLHLDFYKDDPTVPGWPEWIAAQGMTRTAPERGIRFQRITTALEAVLADAGVAICGLALVGELMDDGRLSLPFPRSAGVRTVHVFQARYRGDALVRPQMKRFRDWLIAEAAVTAAWLDRRSGQPQLA
jgi:LysR family glycine cleavage system transcriptional activator